jgi:hypothetical protein
LRLNERKWQENGEICIVQNFMLYSLQQILFWALKFMTIRWTILWLAWWEKSVETFGRNLKEGYQFEDLCLEVRLVLKPIFKNQIGWAWIG